jgi:RNA polymerase sigma-70 factor (ECF subfamily)
MDVEATVVGDEPVAEPVPEFETFEAFYERGYRPMVRLSLALTGDRLASEDLVQDVFVDAHRQWGRISSYDQPAAWLRRAVINRSRSVLRRARTELRARARLVRTDAEGPTLSNDAQEFWAAVRSLSTRQAQCIALRYLDDLSIAEIATVLGCAEGTVRVHLHRGRIALADRLDVPLEDG